MLELAQPPVGIVRGPRAACIEQAEVRRELEEGEVPDVPREPGMRPRVPQHEELDGELDIDEAAGIVLQVEEPRAVGMAVMELPAHLGNRPAQLLEVARLAQYRNSQRLERGADLAVPRDEAGTGERLLLPHPRLARLVFAVGRERAHQQPARSVRPQPQVGFVEHPRRRQAGEPVVDALREPRVILGCLRRSVVVEEDEIEIGGVPELLAAKLPVADYGKARHLAVAGAQAPGHAEHLLEHYACEIAQMIAQRLDRQHARQVLRDEAHGMRVLEVPQDVHLLLGVSRGGVHLHAQLAGRGRPVRRGVERARVQQLVEQDRMGSQVLGNPGAGAHHRGEPRQRLRVFLEQREICAAARDALEQADQPLEGDVGVLPGGGGLDRERHQPVEQRLARGRHLPVAARRTHVPQPLLDGAGIAEAEPGQDIHRFVGGEAALPQVRERVLGFGGGGKNRLEVPGDNGAMLLERGGKRSVVGEAHCLGEERAVRLGRGNDVGLLVVEVLQPVLEVPQEAIRFRELLRRGAGQQVAAGEQRQNGERGLRPQLGLAPAADQLEHLRDELDLADAAGTELDVVRDVTALHLAADLAVQVAQGGDRVVIHVPPIDEGQDPFHQLGAAVAGQRSSLDPGVALPFPALGDEVVLERIEARDERAGVPVRPQPHVHPEDVSVGGDLGEHGDQPAAEYRAVLLVADRAGSLRFPVLRVDEDQVDIGGDIQLGAAELAHAQHMELLDAMARGADRSPVPPGQP